jgi:hypothetical protein
MTDNIDKTKNKKKSKSKSKSKRCCECNKKINIMFFNCKCGNIYCDKHRYSFEHNCSFDYKKEQQIILEKNNPVVKADKIKDRI